MKVHTYSMAGEPRIPVPIVLLHGWACDSRIWEPLIPIFNQWSNVLTIDLEYKKLTPELLYQVIVEQAPDGFILCGWSLGGMLAIQLASCYPEKVYGLMTLSSNLSFVAKPGWEKALAENTFKQFSDTFERDNKKGLKRFLLLETHGDKFSKDQLQWLNTLYEHDDYQSEDLVAGLGLLADIDNTDLLSDIACPSLYLFGEKDSLVPNRVIDDIVPMLSDNQQAVVLQERGHLLHYPAEYIASDLNSFLSRLSCS